MGELQSCDQSLTGWSAASHKIAFKVAEQALRSGDIVEEIHSYSDGRIVIRGRKSNGNPFCETQRIYGISGVVQTASTFKADMSREEKIEAVRQLNKAGYKQREIAAMLGISQSQVSMLLKLLPEL